MPMRIHAVTETHPGSVRDRNEDYARALVPSAPHDDTALLIVADGMGAIAGAMLPASWPSKPLNLIGVTAQGGVT